MNIVDTPQDQPSSPDAEPEGTEDAAQDPVAEASEAPQEAGVAEDTGAGEAAPAPGAEFGAEARVEIDALKDRLLRVMADGENLRRRAERERTETAKYAITDFARDLLAVADNLGRALETLPDEARDQEAIKGFIEGVELTGRELVNVFEKHGVQAVHPEGEKFDHNLHQAMFEVEDPDKPHGTVTQVMQIGYVIHDRLLRPAMVGVSKTGGEKDTEPGDGVDVKA